MPFLKRISHSDQHGTDGFPFGLEHVRFVRSFLQDPKRYWHRLAAED